MNSMRRLMVVGALIIGTLGLTAAPAFASPSTAPSSAGHTTYYSSTNHYRIYDTKKDHRAVAVRFYRPGGAFVGFQSCHEGAGESCPGDLPRSVRGQLCMQTGVGLGSDPRNYRYGGPRCFNA